ncbi:MAG: hypothetical protein ACE37K_15705 [Planctomycetota bacterium]
MATKKRKATAEEKATKKQGRKSNAGSKSAQIRDLLKTGMKPTDIAKKVGCTLPLVYNVRSRVTGGPKKRGGGGHRKNASAPAAIEGVDSILAAVKQSEQERAALRKALQQIQAVLDGAFA